MKIGNIEITGRAALAPMAGVTDAAYRQVCARFGAAYTVTEMVSARAVTYGDKKTAEIAGISQDARPVFIQLFGEDPMVMAQAAQKLMALAPDGFDLNMGCPVPKVAGNGAGSALMKEPETCAQMVRAVKEAVPVPVTVKIRAGWDPAHKNAVQVAALCQQAGAAAIAVHGRTREEMYRGRADWDIIRQVKEAVTVPVIGNGDVTGAQSARNLLMETGCDMVMVGRGALGNPWVFREINAYLTDSCTILPPPGLAERLLAMRRHIGLMADLKGEPRAMREARKHVGWYLHGLRGAADFRRRAGLLSTLSDLDKLVEDVYRANYHPQQEADL